MGVFRSLFEKLTQENSVYKEPWKKKENQNKIKFWTFELSKLEIMQYGEYNIFSGITWMQQHANSKNLTLVQ